MAIYIVDDSRVLAMWENDYRNAIALGNAPDYGPPDAMVVVAPGRYGDTAILMRFPDDRYLSVYFNQSGELDPAENGTPRYEHQEAERDPREWLDIMSGATNWDHWEWVNSRPSRC